MISDLRAAAAWVMFLSMVKYLALPTAWMLLFGFSEPQSFLGMIPTFQGFLWGGLAFVFLGILGYWDGRSKALWLHYHAQQLVALHTLVAASFPEQERSGPDTKEWG